jgi:hypothetical protein
MSSNLFDQRWWRRASRRQLAQFPICRWHEERGKIVPAEVAHHVERHQGDRTKFRMSPLISLCKQCHDSIAQQREVNGYSKEIGPDGYPTCEQHPFNRASK